MKNRFNQLPDAITEAENLIANGVERDEAVRIAAEKFVDALFPYGLSLEGLWRTIREGEEEPNGALP